MYLNPSQCPHCKAHTLYNTKDGFLIYKPKDADLYCTHCHTEYIDRKRLTTLQKDLKEAQQTIIMTWNNWNKHQTLHQDTRDRLKAGLPLAKYKL